MIENIIKWNNEIMKAVFLTQPHEDYPNPLAYHYEVNFLLKYEIFEDLITTDLSVLSFDLFT